MTVLTATSRASTKHTFTIRCEPAAGNVHDPAVGCVELAKRKADYFGVPSFEVATSFGSVILIHGTYDGQPISLTYRSGQYPQGDAWGTLISGSKYGSDSHGGIRPPIKSL